MFTIFVADNFHYADENETYKHGEYETWLEAVDSAKKLVDRSLADEYQPGITAAALYHQYVSFGDDPYIVPTPVGEHFSAWEYAKKDAPFCVCPIAPR